MLAEILYKESLTKEEMNQIQTVLSDPLIKKYFRIIGQNDLAELTSLGVASLGDSEVAKKHALVQGKLSTIVTLLNIKSLGVISWEALWISFKPQTQPSSVPAEGTTPPNTSPARIILLRIPLLLALMVKCLELTLTTKILWMSIVKCLIMLITAQTYRHPPLRLILRF